MQLLFTGELSNAVLQAICWTLIHSLWQGLIAAVIVALIVTFTKRSAASVRYNLLVAVLSFFILGISITAARQLQSAGSGIDQAVANSTLTNSFSPANFETGEGMIKDKAVTQNLAEQFSAFCNEHASLIVLIWFLLFLIKCSQLLASIRYIQRVRHRNNYEVTSYWKDRLSELAQKTGIRRTILFLESELVKVPAVIGFLKPVLLVPAGLLANLPPEQVEAILLHELAHIRRRDFLINLLQSLIETFFFFNPAIVWISSLLREEREACCDDMVVANIPYKTNYLQALVSFQELQLHLNTGAMALTGNKHYLFNRVKRMLTLENKKLNLMEKTVLLLGILGITAFSFISKEAKNPVPVAVINNEIIKPFIREPQAMAPMTIIKKPVIKQKKTIVLSLPQQDIDTVPKTASNQKEERSFPSISSNSRNDGKNTESQIEATDNEGKHYTIKRIDGQITQLTVNGTVIPQDKYGDYSEVIGQLDEAQRQHILKRKEYIQKRKEYLFARQKEMQEKRKEIALKNRKEMDQKLELKKEMQIENNLKREQNRKLFEQKKAEIIQNKKLYNQKKAEMMQSEKLYNQRKAQVIQNEKLYHQRKAEVIQREKIFKPGRKSNDDISRIISDLNNRKLVSDEDNLSFSLTNNELIVNGTKQPAEIHQQFKEKYLQNSGDRFNYSKKGNTTSITINKE